MGFAWELAFFLIGKRAQPPRLEQLLPSLPPLNRNSRSKMSVTTTQNPTVYATQDVLKDYELHHSGSSNAAPPPNPNPAPRVQNPPDWDTEHRRVPPYRPVNRELDLSVRRVFANGRERTFINIMFTGVLTEAVSRSKSQVMQSRR